MIRESRLVVLPEDRRPACAQLHKRSEFGALQLSVFNHNSRRIHLPPGLCLCPERPVDSVSDFAREMNALNLDHAPVPRSISFPPSFPAVIKGQRRPRCTGCPTQNKDSLRTILDPIPIGSARTVELQSGITIWRFSVKTPDPQLGILPSNSIAATSPDVVHSRRNGGTFIAESHSDSDTSERADRLPPVAARPERAEPDLQPQSLSQRKLQAHFGRQIPMDRV